MKVFISWSGPTAQLLARTMTRWLPLFIPTVEPWMSEENIEPGQRWREVLARELDNQNFGILCLTPENLTSPWIMFEAGALAKPGNNTRVIPFLFRLQIQDLRDPLSLFNALEANRKGTRTLIETINHLMESPLNNDQLNHFFQAGYGKFEEELATIPEGTISEPKTSPEQITLELLSLMRSQTRSVEELSSTMTLIQQSFDLLSGRLQTEIMRIASYANPRTSTHVTLPPFTIDQIRKNWNDILVRLQRVNTVAAAYLREAEALTFEGATLLVGFFYPVHAERFNADKRIKTDLEQVLVEIFGVLCEIKGIASPKRAKVEAVQIDPLIRAGVNLGGKLPVISDDDRVAAPDEEWTFTQEYADQLLQSYPEAAVDNETDSS